MKLLLMADGPVGVAVTRWLLDHFPDDVSFVVTTAENEVWTAARDAGVPSLVFQSNQQVCAGVERLSLDFDLGLLAWWPVLIREPLLSKPRCGFVNTHPSFLPHNRGKHYNFWALVEGAPFGVSLHTVDAGVDSGDVIAQQAIPYGWEDNGGTLYAKATVAMVQLVQESYPLIRRLTFPRRPQDLSQGSFHRSTELDAASRIDLDREYRARDLLNLLRARTFPGHPACWFVENGERFEVRVDIKRVIG